MVLQDSLSIAFGEFVLAINRSVISPSCSPGAQCDMMETVSGFTCYPMLSPMVSSLQWRNSCSGTNTTTSTTTQTPVKQSKTQGLLIQIMSNMESIPWALNV